MSETTIAAPLSGEEIVEALRDELTRKLISDCHLNPALGYLSFEAHMTGMIVLRDNGREETIEFEIHLADRPPNVVRQAAGLPIPTLVEDGAGRKEIKPVQYGRGDAAEREKHDPKHDPKKPTPPAPQPGQPPHSGPEPPKR